MEAAQAFFRSAKAVTGVTPDRVTTDGHDSYPRAIRTEPGKDVRHRTSAYLNNRLEQGVQGGAKSGHRGGGNLGFSRTLRAAGSSFWGGMST